MAESFRTTPPAPRERTIVRRRVQAALFGRFDRRLTTVAAGAGFGKTTALARAVHENRLAPVGTDLWLSCDPADGDASRLASDLIRSLTQSTDALPQQTRPTVTDIVDLVAGRAPDALCLIVDDVHVLDGDSSGAAALAELVDRLPDNGHVLLSGRSLPRRLAFTPTLGEGELAFTAHERAELAGLTGRLASDLDDLGGWPALVDLVASHGPSSDMTPADILLRLAGRLGPQLDCLVATAGAGPELIAEICGEFDERELLALPLVDRRGDRLVPHDLWIGARSSSARVAEYRDRAIDLALAQQRFSDAVELILQAVSMPGERTSVSETERLEDALLGALGRSPDPDADQLDRWLRRLPAGLRPTPAGRLLEGMVGRIDAPAAASTSEALLAAARGYAAREDPHGEAVALSALTYPLHVRRDGAGLTAAYTRLADLARDGIAEAEQQSQLGSAVVATSLGRLEQVKALVEPIVDATSRSSTRAAALWMLANAQNGLGEPSLDTARELTKCGYRLPGTVATPVTAMWRLGMVTELLAQPDTDADGDRDRYVLAVWKMFLALETGRLDVAERQLELIRSHRSPVGYQADGSDLYPEVALAVERGDDEHAIELIRAGLARHPLDGPSRGNHVMATGLIYRLCPEHRRYLDRLQLGPLFRRDRSLARALVAVIDDDDLEPMRHLELPVRAGELLPAIGLRQASELLSAAWTAGTARVEFLVTDLLDLVGEPARARFKVATEHPHRAISAGARRVLAAAPVVPRGSAVLRLLGQTELVVDGRSIESPDWNRERVRSLLTFLALHPTPTRERAIAELWPEADTESGRRNLRSTLNRLQRVLEPGRDPGEAPYHVRSSGQHLRLVGGGRLIVDVDRFRAELDEARRRERDGTPSLAIAHYRAACDLYRGDLLPDSYAGWVLVQRDQLRAEFVRAAVRCAELLTVTDRVDEALALGARTLTIEPHAESAHRALVAAHLARHDLAAAQRAMQTCERLLDDVGGIADEATLVVRRRLARHQLRTP